MPDSKLLTLSEAIQRSDEYGNAHAWGNLGVTRDACLASRNVILTAEEISVAGLAIKNHVYAETVDYGY